MRTHKSTQLGKKLGAALLTAALAFSGLTIASPTEAQAATKPTKLTVSTSSTTLGTSKTLYISGPAAYKKTTIKVSVTPKKASAKVKYTSSNKKVVSVTTKGVVVAKKVGTAKVTVQSKANTKLKKTIKFTVKKYVYPTKVTAKATNSTIYNSTGTLNSTTVKSTVTPTTATVKKVTYTSNNKALATVSAAGKVTANTKGKTGTVKITVKSTEKNKKGKYLSATVSIKVANRPGASSVKLNSTARAMTITGTNANPTTTLTATITPEYANKSVSWSSSNKTVATVSKGVVTAKAMGTTTITAKTTNGKTATCKITVKRASVSVHDPSVVKGDDGYYYVFGSHMAWARSKTLTGWTTFTNNINTDSTNTGSIFASYWNNWAKYNKNGVANKDNSDATIALNGNEWAPDVIYNKAMKKWCMYMSVNGPDNNSVIVLCTADSLTGTWTNVGAVVYSGFTNRDGVAGHNVSYTDYNKVTGETTVASRYLSGTSWNLYYGTNAIDPCVKYDENGDLWMSYGSWFGGIYMIKLDETTGLRDYNYTYDYDTDDSDGTTSDPYMGIRVAGGNRASGEASYIIEKDGYYYMFLSYGGLEAANGYNMRVFRSENITGPYTDKAGYSALRTNTNGAGNTLGNIGIRLMAGYKWSCNTKGYLAQGHNSALVDDDGKMYLVFHTRTDDGTEGHYVKTHQMYMSEDGWLCVAPYEYNGETISETGYSNSDIIGTYEYLVQNPSQANGTCATTTTITLGADGSIGGLDAAGTWSVKNGTYYATFVINGVTYQGVFAKGSREDTDKTEVMTFTAVGDNNVCIWGSKTTVTDLETAQSSDATALTLAASVEADFYLPTYGGNGSTITWVSSDENVIKIEGRKAIINRRLTDTKATLTATIKNGTYSSTKAFTVTVKKYDVSVDSLITTDTISLPTKVGNATVEWTSSDESVISTTGEVAKVINDTPVTLTATLKLDGDTDVVKTFGVTVEGIVIDVASVIKTTYVELPTESEGFAITWKSSDESVIDSTTGKVTKPKSEKTIVTLTAVIGDEQVEREITVAVLPEEFSDYVYSQDFEAVDTVTDVFSSYNMSDGISIETEDANSYLQFAQDSGMSGNRGGMGNFNEAVQSLEEYVVEFDLAIRSGNVADRSQSQFVLTGTDTTTTIRNNDGTSAGYILKLSTGPSSTTWTINDSTETVEIPADTWVHVTAVVSTKNQRVQLEITQDNNVLYKGITAVNGTGFLQGMYILSGRGNGLTKVDNIKVY